MAEIKPYGIDQATGVRRLVESSDNIVNNTAEQLCLAATRVHDYSGNANNVRKIFPWTSTPTKLANPATLPAADNDKIAWSPDGEFFATIQDTTPFLNIYQRSGNVFNKLPDVATLPSNAGWGVDWSPDGEFLSVVHGLSPGVALYQRDGTSFTKLADPATVNGTSFATSWSPNSEFLAIHNGTSPYILVYHRDGTTFTKLADPSTALPNGALGAGVTWSPDNKIIVVAHRDSPYVSFYQRDGVGASSTLTKLADPTTLPALTGRWATFSLADDNLLAVSNSNNPHIDLYRRSGTTFTKITSVAAVSTVMGVSWSPDGMHLAAATSQSPYIAVYQWDGASLTALNNPATLPTGAANNVRFSPNGEFLVVVHNTSPYITIYQTDKTLPDRGIMMVAGPKKAGS